MRKIITAALMLTIFMLIFSGCGINDEQQQSTKDDEVMTQVKAMKEQNKTPKEMFDYLNQNISQLNKGTATEAVGILVSTLEEYETVYNEQLVTDENLDLMYQYFELKFEYAKIESVKEQGLKDLLYEIILGGLKIVDQEGTFMVIADYDALKTFDEYIDDELKSYIEIMALNFNNPVAVDASIAVQPEELEKRILQMESYIKSYENQQREENIISMYLGHMMVYMSGTDNTAVFDQDTGTIHPDMFKTFENASSKYKDTTFGKVMNQYVALLKQEGFSYTEKVQDFILNIDIAE